MTKHQQVGEPGTREILHLTTWYPTRPDDPTGTFVSEHIQAVAGSAPSSVLHITWADTEGARRYAVTDVAVPGAVPVLRLTILPGAAAPAWLVVGLLHALVRELVARGRPRLLHTHTTSASVLGAVLGVLLRRPFVATEHWTGLLPGGEGHRFSRRLLTRMAFQRAALVMPVGPSLAEGIRPLTGRTPIEVVPNVVDTSVFTPAEPSATRAGRIVAIGSLIPRKRVDLIIRAVALARQTRPGLSLIVVGDGPEMQSLQDLATDLEIDHAVAFRGAIAKPEVAAELRSADVLVIASDRETFSVVAAEAMCCGVPVVTTMCGGPEHLVDRQSGILLNESDDDSFARALISATSRDWDRMAISRTAQTKFSPGAISRRLQTVYASASSRGPAAGA